MNIEIAMKYTDINYCNKNEVTTKVGSYSSETVWKMVNDYRDKYRFPLEIKMYEQRPSSVVLTPQIMAIANSLDILMGQYHSKLNLYSVYERFSDEKKYQFFKDQCLKKDLFLLGNIKELDINTTSVDMILDYADIKNMMLKSYNDAYKFLLNNQDLEFNKNTLKEIVRNFNMGVDDPNIYRFDDVDYTKLGCNYSHISEHLSMLFNLYNDNYELSPFIIASIVMIYFIYINPLKSNSNEVAALLFNKALQSLGYNEAGYLVSVVGLLNNEHYSNFLNKIDDYRKTGDITYPLFFVLSYVKNQIKERISELNNISLPTLYQDGIKIVTKEVPVEVEKEVIKEIEVPVEVVKEVIKEVEVEVEKEVIKEVPYETIKEVVREVPVEIIKEVTVFKDRPVEVIKEVEVPVEVVKEIEKPVEIVHEIIKEVPVEIIKEVIKEIPVEVVKEVEVPVEVIKEVEKEVLKEVEVPVEVIKEIEIPVEVIKEVEKEVIKEVEVPVEVIKEVPIEVIKEVEIPVEIIKEVPVEVIKEVEVPVEVIKEIIREVPVEVIKEVPIKENITLENDQNDYYGDNSFENNEEQVKPKQEIKKEETNIYHKFSKEEIKNILNETNIANRLIQLNPLIRDYQARYYEQNHESGMFYTISSFKDFAFCAYETARTSMDFLCEIGLYEKRQIKNKFIYTPVGLED